MDADSTATTLMERELEDALGEQVSEQEARDAAHRPRTTGTFLRENRLLIGILGATALVLGAMLGLAFDSFWFVLIAMAVHLAATLFIATFAIRLASEVEKPSPTTVTRFEALGVRGAEQAINAALRAHETPNRAAAQSESNTPSSVPTELVGPGSSGSLSDR
jgi:hypothetical protein